MKPADKNPEQGYPDLSTPRKFSDAVKAKTGKPVSDVLGGLGIPLELQYDIAVKNCHRCPIWHICDADGKKERADDSLVSPEHINVARDLMGVTNFGEEPEEKEPELDAEI